MIRILAFVCMTAFAASRAETTTYVDGNLPGISPNTGGTLLLSDDKTLVFRTGLATVTVPFKAITKSELGATRETSHASPAYKIWAHHKKTETQFLSVDFKTPEGEPRSMTLELSQAAAPAALAAIQQHTSKTQLATGKPIVDLNDRGSKASPATKPGSDWWGDDIWKTTRNSSTWSKPAATVAPEE